MRTKRVYLPLAHLVISGEKVLSMRGGLNKIAGTFWYYTCKEALILFLLTNLKSKKCSIYLGCFVQLLIIIILIIIVIQIDYHRYHVHQHMVLRAIFHSVCILLRFTLFESA